MGGWFLVRKPESVGENESHKILLGFNIQTDHVFPIRRPDLASFYKKKKELVYLQISPFHRTTENEKIDKYLDLAGELKKTVEHEVDVNTNCSWCAWNENWGNMKKE